MIDTHAHPELMGNAEEVLHRCRNAGMKAIISVATHPRDFEKALIISKRHKEFVFPAAGVHPEYVREINEKEIDSAIEWIRKNEKSLVGIGEQGLDYFWVKEQAWREKQNEMFARFIELSRELDKVCIVHTREAYDDVVRILEKNNAERVQLHMWGDSSFSKQITDSGWYVSVGPVIANSKKHKKVVRDIPIEQLMLETDSPWFGGKDASGKLLGEPTNIKIPAGKIAEVKEMEFDDVMKVCAKNAVKLFRVPLQI